MRPLLVLALVAPGFLLAGCLTDDITDFVGARQHFDVATAEARTWDADAVFVGLLAVEPADHEEVATGEAAPSYAPALSFTDDLDVGDGLAQAWLYLFRNEAEGFGVVVSHQGEVSGTIRIDPANEEVLQLEGVLESQEVVDWRYDSEAAARQAWGYAPFAELAGERGVNGFMSLHHDDTFGGPLWFFGLWNLEGDGTFLAVDARNGTLITDEDMPGIFVERPPFESGSMDNEVTVLEPVAEDTFELDHEGHLALYAAIDRQDGTPLADIEAELVDPDGERHALSAQQTFFFTSWDEVLVEEPTAGTWTIRVSAQLGTVSQAYTFHWCTWEGEGDPPSGMDTFFGPGVDPCLVESGAATAPWRAAWLRT